MAAAPAPGHGTTTWSYQYVQSGRGTTGAGSGHGRQRQHRGHRDPQRHRRLPLQPVRGRRFPRSRRGRRLRRWARPEVQPDRERLDQRRAVLQVGRQHPHPRGRWDRCGPAARPRHLHRQERQWLAAGPVRGPGRGHGRHDVRRLLHAPQGHYPAEKYAFSYATSPGHLSRWQAASGSRRRVSRRPGVLSGRQLRQLQLLRRHDVGGRGDRAAHRVPACAPGRVVQRPARQRRDRILSKAVTAPRRCHPHSARWRASPVRQRTTPRPAPSGSPRRARSPGDHVHRDRCGSRRLRQPDHDRAHLVLHHGQANAGGRVCPCGSSTTAPSRPTSTPVTPHRSPSACDSPRTAPGP